MRPAYGIDCHNSIEFFETRAGLRVAFAGQLYTWEEVPAQVKTLVRNDLERHPEALHRLKNFSADEQLRIYVRCKWGGRSQESPDLTLCGESFAEHWDCKCSMCPLKDVLRGKMKVHNGYLSDREIEVAKLIAEGHLGKQIADLLHIAESTINTHKSHIFEKLGVHSNVELTAWALRVHLI